MSAATRGPGKTRPGGKLGESAGRGGGARKISMKSSIREESSGEDEEGGRLGDETGERNREGGGCHPSLCLLIPPSVGFHVVTHYSAGMRPPVPPTSPPAGAGLHPRVSAWTGPREAAGRRRSVPDGQMSPGRRTTNGSRRGPGGPPEPTRNTGGTSNSPDGMWRARRKTLMKTLTRRSH